MTVISTIITKHYVALASDSFLTTSRSGGLSDVIEYQESKLVRVPAWKGAMGYWGLARDGARWNTFEWLQTQAGRAGDYASPAKFAAGLGEKLTHALSGLRVAKPLDRGLGIHLTVYERVRDYWIPEIFVLSNFTDVTYSEVLPQGFRVSRETYATLRQLRQADEHGDPACRLEVHTALQQGIMFLYNNGDPILFNPIANAILESFKKLLERGQLKDPSSVSTHLSIARRPVYTSRVPATHRALGLGTERRAHRQVAQDALPDDLGHFRDGDQDVLMKKFGWPRVGIWWQFAAVCFLFAVLFVFVPLWLHYSPSFCPPHKDVWTVKGNEYSKRGKQKPETPNYTITKEKKHSNKGDKDTADADQDSFICDELKLTDVLIAYFTLCLVVVGWFTMRSADENTKRKERAYVIAAGLRGIPKRNTGGWLRDNRAKSSMFNGPWRMAIQNLGQTPGFTTKVEWGICSNQVFEERNGARVSELFEVEFSAWRKKCLRLGCTEVQDIFRPTEMALQYRHVEIPDELRKPGNVFFGRIDYKDVFRDPHYSTFALRITKDGEHTDGIADAYSDDHD